MYISFNTSIDELIDDNEAYDFSNSITEKLVIKGTVFYDDPDGISYEVYK